MRGGTGKRELPGGGTLAIWQDVDGYYYLIDTGDGREQENVGPFETALEAEEDAHAWWALRHADEDPDLL